MTIKHVPSGDKFKASQLWGEGRHQLSILKNLMSFQKLQQDQRTVEFEDGTIIKCLSCFGQDVINVFVPIPEGVEEEREEISHDFFRFRITRDDSLIIDETMLRRVTPGIAIYRKMKEYPNPTEDWQLEMVGLALGRDPDSSNWTQDGDVLFYEGMLGADKPFKFSYNTVTQIWTVDLFTWLSYKVDYELEDISLYDKDYWVEIRCEEESINCWFAKSTQPNEREYAYKEADFFDDQDRVEPAFYDLTIPVWIIEEEDNNPVYAPQSDYSHQMGVGYCDGRYNMHTALPHNYSWPQWHSAQDYFYEKITVISSVPYKVTEQIPKVYPTSFGCWGYTASGGYNVTPWNAAGCGDVPGSPPGDTGRDDCCPNAGAYCTGFPVTVQYESQEISLTAGEGVTHDAIIEEYIITPPEHSEEKEHMISMTFSHSALSVTISCSAGWTQLPGGSGVWRADEDGYWYYTPGAGEALIQDLRSKVATCQWINNYTQLGSPTRWMNIKVELIKD